MIDKELLARMSPKSVRDIQLAEDVKSVSQAAKCSEKEAILEVSVKSGVSESTVYRAVRRVSKAETEKK